MINKFEGEYRWLSNFWWVVDTTVEHLYQAEKTLNAEERARILGASTPGKAKRLGRGVTLRPDWDDVKLDVMLKLVRRKFNHPTMARKLLETGGQEIVEGNTWHDNFWGNCTCPKCRHIEGQNHLGRIIMQVREELQT